MKVKCRFDRLGDSTKITDPLIQLPFSLEEYKGQTNTHQYNALVNVEMGVLGGIKAIKWKTKLLPPNFLFHSLQGFQNINPIIDIKKIGSINFLNLFKHWEKWRRKKLW